MPPIMKLIYCSLCSSTFTSPVTLHCGHNFCCKCIRPYINKHGKDGIYCCPECKQPCRSRAPLTINKALGNLAQSVTPLENFRRRGLASCTYCLERQSPAVKVCLHCESSLCAKHLEVHSKAPEHSLSDVNYPLHDRVCSVHGGLLKFFCKEDKTLICMVCFLTGDHQRHGVELLEVASGHKKEELQKMAHRMRSDLNNLKNRTGILQQILTMNKNQAQLLRTKYKALSRSFLTSIRELARNMEDHINQQEAEACKGVADEIASLEEKEKHLSEKIKQVSSVCSQDDPLLTLQVSTPRKRRKKEHRDRRRGVEIDEVLTSLLFKRSFETFVESASTLLSSHCLHLRQKANILLDIGTASNYLRVSADLKSVRYTAAKIKRAKRKPGQFQTSQVLSTSAFSSGLYYWEVRAGKNGVKGVGVAYPSISKEGPDAFIGYNEKSWCLTWSRGYMTFTHNSQCVNIESDASTMTSVAVYVNYDIGLLSWYRVGSSVEPLFTCRTEFTEPLHPAFYLVDSWIKINH